MTEAAKPAELEAGVHRGIDDSVYHAKRLGWVSKSALDRIDRSPQHYLSWLRGESDKDTKATLLGRAFHSATLEPEVFAAKYVVEPDFGDCRKKENKDRRNAWRLANGGKLLVSAEDKETIVGMAKSIRAHPYASKLLRGGEPELTVCWKDKPSGLMCKSRLDYYREKFATVVDLKSTMDARRFASEVFSRRYHVQDALYREGGFEAGLDIQNFIFVAVEKEPPFAVACYQLTQQAIEKGAQAARRNIDRLAECIETNKWPAYEEGITEIDLPPWAE